MKRYKTKLGRILNFIKNEGKFKRADLVQVLDNDLYNKNERYSEYRGQYAVVTDIDYTRTENIVRLKFLDGETLRYKPSELRKCNATEHITNMDYRKLLKMI